MSRFIFSATAANGSADLYATDGSLSGTTDLAMSRFGFSPLSDGLDFVALGGRSYFLGAAVSNGVPYTGVFGTDGTPAGTAVAAIAGVVPDALWSFGSLLLASDAPSSGPVGLWASADGSSFTELEASVAATDVTVSGPLAFFGGVGQNGAAAGLWRTDGTAAGTLSLAPGGQSLDPHSIVPLSGGRVLFSNLAADGSRAVWVSDGTADGTRPLTAAGLGSDVGGAFSGGSVGGKAIFTANDASGNISVWVSDGTAAGTSEIMTVGPDTAPLRQPGGYVAWNNKVLFSTGYALAVSDGTRSGTAILSETSAPIAYIGMGSRVFFIATDPSGASAPDGTTATALFVSDGTQAGTSVLRVAGLGSLGDSQLAVVGGRLLFSALDGSGHQAIFSTDGTAAGTTELHLPAGVSLGGSTPPAMAPLPDPSSSLVTLGAGAQHYATRAGDSVQAGSGSDTVTAASGRVTVTGAAGHLTFVGSGATGSVSGAAGAVTVFAGGGGGHFTGGSGGHNILVSDAVAGSGNTTLTGAGYDNALFGSAEGGDVLQAGSGRSVIIGGGGAESISGGGAPGSVIFTGSGHSTVTGGAGGHDTIVGGTGDLLVEAAHGEAVFGGSGALTVAGSATGAADSIVGGGGTLNVTGAGGNMVVAGGSGAADVATGNGAALVFQGAGRMQLTTGGGPVQVVLSYADLAVREGGGAVVYDLVKGTAAGGNDSIAGFRAGTDRIELFGYKPGDITVQSSASQTVLHVSDGKQITLAGVAGLGNSLAYG